MGFWLLFAINAILAAVFAFFFFSGAGSGAVASTNLVVWSLIFFVLCGDLLAALVMKLRGLEAAAFAMLAGFYFPALLAALLVSGVIAF